VLLVVLTQAGLIALQGKWLYKNYKDKKAAFAERLDKAMDGLYRAIDPGDALHDQLLEMRKSTTSPSEKGRIAGLFASKLKQELLRQSIDTIFSITLYKNRGAQNLGNNRIREQSDQKTFPSSSLLFSNTKNVQAADYWVADICPACGIGMGINFQQIKPSFFLTQMIDWILVTLGLTSIQIIVFVYIVWGIFRQKKLAALKDAFINHMAHELNTPIFSISLAVKHLKALDLSRQSDEARQYLQIIENEKSRIKTNVQRALDITRLESDNVFLKKEAFNLHGLMEKIEALFRLRIKENKVFFSMELKARQPQVYADPHLIFNALYNLIDNAVKYSFHEPVKIELSTKDAAEGTLKISIRDNGAGIPESEQKKVFDKFYRSSKLQHVKGSGLGLNYAQMVVDAHGGHIQLESQEGKGSTFSIFLPKNLPSENE